LSTEYDLTSKAQLDPQVKLTSYPHLHTYVAG
jgi:hypothetical protein